MIRFPLPELGHLAVALERLASVQVGTIADNAEAIFGAQFQLHRLLNSGALAEHLRSSRPLIQQIGTNLDEYYNRFVSSGDQNFSQFDVWNTTRLFSELKIALFAELGAFTSYIAVSKGGYDINTLLENPEKAFPSDLSSKVPEAIFEVREACRSLAYELPTACGFHAFRAVECVLRQYFASVTSGATAPKVRSMRVYTRALRQYKVGDEKVLSVLDQLADLHRNPLAHPDAILTLDEAIDVFGLSRSAISTMLRAIPAPSRVQPEQTGLLGGLLATVGLNT